MSDEGDENRLLEVERHVCDEKRRVENWSVVEGHGFLDNGLSKGNLIEHDKRGGSEGISWASASRLMSQQTSQGPSVCWERFLNVRSLRVLLVENDDCTRNVVSALLRNCYYEVIEASNGIQAWKILEDITTPVDLVLAEVIMPFLSGIGLLCKIKSHKTRKNVPVIMMSSHDSMGLVFKCLLKGAVDFLVKPIRKNELKNLWQHVWRRCHSSSDSGSGSETGAQTQKYMKSKGADKSEVSSSNSKEDNQSPPLNFSDRSDHRSETQSSWTKQAVEDQVESSRLVSLVNNIDECPDSTCAQVIHPNVVPSVDKFMNVIPTKECIVQKEVLGNAEIDDEFDISQPKNSDLQLKVVVEIPEELTSLNQNTAPKIDASETDDQKNDGIMTSRENLCSKLHCPDGKVVGMVLDCTETTVGRSQSSRPTTFPKISETNEKKELPLAEQRLKRLMGAQEVGKAVEDDRKVLRRSQSSAFSRYNATMNYMTSDPRSLSHFENEWDRKNELMHHIQSQSGSNAPTHCSNGGSFYIDMTSSSNNGVNEALNFTHMPIRTPSEKDNSLYPNQKPMLENADGLEVSITSIQHKSAHEEARTQVHHQLHSMQPQPFPSPHSVSSSMAPVEGNAGNSSHGSTSGSNHESNGQNGCTTATNVEGLYNENDNGTGDKSGNDDASGIRSGNQLDESKHDQREATLTKFRQKRKER